MGKKFVLSKWIFLIPLTRLRLFFNFAETIKYKIIMKFSDFTYKRPNIEEIQSRFGQLLHNFNAANNVAEQSDCMKQINQLRSEFDTMLNIASIRYSIDTTNKEFEEEQNFFDTYTPVFASLQNDFYRALIKSPFKSELQQKWGQQLFDIASLSLQTFSDAVIQDMQEENKLVSEYTKLIASARIEFDGKICNLSDLGAYEKSKERAVRKRASAAKWKFFADNADKFDALYDKLVKLRHQIALKLGYKNFVELGYNRMLRTDYDASMVADFREQIQQEIVPIAVKLRARQAKRTGIDSLKFYDLPFNFKTGNAKPQGDPNWIVNKGKLMYDELSKETSEFFNFMLQNDLMDLVSKKGKASGGYCTYVSDYKAPFIFSNFNGTADDITVLTHEAGHAFQVYMSRDFAVPEYYWPTYEACEIHSMSMEFFTWPWMHYFFEKDTEKFKFSHLSGSILFLPYGVAVDEFQHKVYENPEASPAERKKMWLEVERKYMPYIDYEGNEFLENGGFWQKQSHIFGMPFYYIDYTLAQICAFQFWKRSEENRSQALNDYVKLCKAGGSQSFLNLVGYANLRSPFEKGCIKETIEPIEAYLEEVNDMVL